MFNGFSCFIVVLVLILILSIIGVGVYKYLNEPPRLLESAIQYNEGICPICGKPWVYSHKKRVLFTFGLSVYKCGTHKMYLDNNVSLDAICEVGKEVLDNIEQYPNYARFRKEALSEISVTPMPEKEN